MEVKEVAKQLGVHINTIYHYLNTKQIKAVKKGKSWDIPESEVTRLKTQQELTPRKIIQMYTYMIDVVERDAEKAMNDVLWLMKRGNEDEEFKQAIERLSDIEKGTKKWDMFIEFKKYLEQNRDRWHYNVEEGYYGMDELVEKGLQQNEKPFEIRTSGDYYIDDET